MIWEIVSLLTLSMNKKFKKKLWEGEFVQKKLSSFVWIMFWYWYSVFQRTNSDTLNHSFPGVYIFHFSFWKIWSIGWLGKKYDYLLRKNANIRGKRWKNGKKVKFSLYLGGKNHFEKRWWGKNILFWENIHPCAFLLVKLFSYRTRSYFIKGVLLGYPRLTPRVCGTCWRYWIWT